MSITEDIANKLADMPNQILPIFPMQFDTDIVNCIAIFPGTGCQRQGAASLFYTALGTLDYPAIRVQVRYTDPSNAFAIAEAIRIWLDANLPTGYLTCRALDPNAKDITDDKSLSMVGGPAYIFDISFQLTKVRA
jgi:hypothetical protein